MTIDFIDHDKKSFVKASEQLNLKDACATLSESAPGYLVVYNNAWVFISTELYPPCGEEILQAGGAVSAQALAAQNASAGRFLPLGEATWKSIESYNCHRHHVESRLKTLSENYRLLETESFHYSLSSAFYDGNYEPLGTSGVDIREKNIRDTRGNHRSVNPGDALFWFDDKPVAISTELVKGLHYLGFDISVIVKEGSTSYDPVVLLKSDALGAIGMAEPKRLSTRTRGYTRDGRSMCISEIEAAWTSPEAALASINTDPHLCLIYARNPSLEDAVLSSSVLGKAVSQLRWSGMPDADIKGLLEDNTYSALQSVWQKEVFELEGLLESLMRRENHVGYYRSHVSMSERKLKQIREIVQSRTGEKLDLPSALLALDSAVEQALSRR